MKKIVISALLAMVSSGVLAEMKSHPVNSNWTILAWTDDFTDKKSCAVTPAKGIKRGTPSIIMFAKHESSGPHTILKASGGIDGVGIKYRVDKNPPVQIGYEYEFQTDDDIYIVRGSEHENMISAFKAGNTLAYKVTSGNQFVDSEADKISLSGFTKAYSLAESCNY